VRSLKLVLLSLSLAFFLLACGSNYSGTTNAPATNANRAAATTSPKPQVSPVDQFAATREIYSKRCEVCHQQDGKGGPVEVAGKKLKVPSLREGHATGHTDEKLAKQIANGGDGMPPFKKLLKPEEIDGLVKFIRQDFQAGAATATSSPAAQKQEPAK
jgi:mono/diheme cytochrome c family protein